MLAKQADLLVWFAVSDLASSIAFYRDILGLAPEHVDTRVGWAELRHGGGVRIALRHAELDELSPAGGATLVFDVPEIEAAISELQDRGVTFVTGAMDLNGYRFATFVDPDGNHLQLRQASRAAAQ